MFKFEKKSPTAQADKEKVVREAMEASADAIVSAQACLRNELFQKYKTDYEYATKLVIEELIELDKVETDPVRYGFQVKDIISKLRHIGSLLRAVEHEAGKRL